MKVERRDGGGVKGLSGASCRSPVWVMIVLALSASEIRAQREFMVAASGLVSFTVDRTYPGRGEDTLWVRQVVLNPTNSSIRLSDELQPCERLRDEFRVERARVLDSRCSELQPILFPGDSVWAVWRLIPEAGGNHSHQEEWHRLPYVITATLEDGAGGHFAEAIRLVAGGARGLIPIEHSPVTADLVADMGPQLHVEVSDGYVDLCIVSLQFPDLPCDRIERNSGDLDLGVRLTLELQGAMDRIQRIWYARESEG